MNGRLAGASTPSTLTLASVAFGLAVTLSVSVLPFVRFAYRSLSAHLVIATAAGVTALMVTYLAGWRLVRRKRWDDLLLVVGLGALAGSNLALTLFPEVAGVGLRFITWASLLGGLVGCAILAVAAFAPSRAVGFPARAGIVAFAAIVAVLVVVGIVVAVLSPGLPVVIDPSVSPEGPATPRVLGPPEVLAVQLAAAGLLGGAAAGFTRRAEHDREPLLVSLGPALALGAFARINYFLFPSLYGHWLYSGDVLRLASFAVLLIGGASQIAADQRALARVAALDERRRVARDLHDGLAHELAFISSRARALSAANGDPATAQLATAAERALDESRDAIAALSSGPERSLDDVLARAAEDVAQRAGARVSLRLSRDLHAAPATRDALRRIVREAVTNAVRHGAARNIEIRADQGNGALHVRVTDDGVGFDPAAASTGFGLTTMRERARAVGGYLFISSQAGHGTSVEVRLP